MRLALVLVMIVWGQVSYAEQAPARVTGIGGVFILSDGDGAALAKWYEQHLGMRLETWGGAILNWQEDKAGDGGMTVWSTAAKDSEWFAPSAASFSSVSAFTAM